MPHLSLESTNDNTHITWDEEIKNTLPSLLLRVASAYIVPLIICGMILKYGHDLYINQNMIPFANTALIIISICIFEITAYQLRPDIMGQKNIKYENFLLKNHINLFTKKHNSPPSLRNIGTYIQQSDIIGNRTEFFKYYRIIASVEFMLAGLFLISIACIHLELLMVCAIFIAALVASIGLLKYVFKSQTFDMQRIFTTHHKSMPLICSALLYGSCLALIYLFQAPVTLIEASAALFLFTRLFTPFIKFQNLLSQHQEHSNIEDNFSLPLPSSKNKSLLQNKVITTTRCTHKIEAMPTPPKTILQTKDISFRMNRKSGLPLTPPDLCIKSNEVILLSDENRAFKTLFLNIIAGSMPVISGEVLLNNKTQNDYSLHDFRQKIGLIDSSLPNFSGTIDDIITNFGQHSLHKIKTPLSILELDEDLAKLPDGFNSKIDNSELDSISPSLRKRIHLARIICAEPDLILLNHTSPRSDTNEYIIIYKLIAYLKGKTAMLISSDDRNIQALANRQYLLNPQSSLEDLSQNKHKKYIQPYTELPL